MFSFLKLFLLCIYFFPLRAVAAETINKANDGNHNKAIFWPQMASLLLPGFDQWWEGKYAEASLYSGLAAFGVIYSSTNETTKDSKMQITNRKYRIGNQLYLVSGGLSAYSSFREAAIHRKQLGDFAFIKKQDSISEILLAPFDFIMLSRLTTILPLSLGVVVHWLIVTDYFKESYQKTALTDDDVFFAATISYNAGVSEEAIMRGWLMPVFYHTTESFFWSNLLQAAIFGALHVPNGTRAGPFQFVSGLYNGWVVLRNEWSLSEVVFQHFWWDVLVISAAYQHERLKNKIQPLWVPVLELKF